MERGISGSQNVSDEGYSYALVTVKKKEHEAFYLKYKRKVFKSCPYLEQGNIPFRS